MPAWDDYRFFLAVARLGSLSAAARALGVTQPTVGRRIEQLETALRNPLFVREQSGFTLTPAGSAVLRHVEQMEREALGAESALAGADDAGRPLVRIATTLSLAVNWLSGRVAAFSRIDPSLRLAIKTGISFTDVRHFQADIALRLGEPGEEALFGRRIGSVHCGLYASHDYLLEYGEPAALEQLGRHAIIESEGEIEHLRQADRLREVADCGASSSSSSSSFMADNTAVQLAACMDGCGIATQMCLVADARPQLKRVLAKEFDVPLDLWLLINRELRNSPAVRSVFDYLAREAEASAGQFEGKERAPRPPDHR